jgi:hypothetical protein
VLKIEVSGFSAAAGQKNGRSNRKRNPEKENIEYRIMNVEYRRNVFYLFLKKRWSEAIPHFDIRYSIFCGSLFSPTADCQSNQSNHQQTVPFWRSFIQGVRCQGKEMLDTET